MFEIIPGKPHLRMNTFSEQNSLRMIVKLLI